MGKFAAKTTVSVHASQEEIRRVLKRYGASKTLFYEEDGYGLVEFEIRNRTVRFVVDMPEVKTFAKDDYGRIRTTQAGRLAWEQEERRRWRVLLLLLKGKLEVVEDEAVPFDYEFLGHIVLPDRTTVGENMVPRIARAYDEGHMPDMLEDLLPPKLLALPAPREQR